MLNVIDSDVAVVGREHELAVIRSFVAERRGPAALVLRGDAGIGKTTLWDAGVAAGSSAGYRVLRCRPAVAEAQLPFAAVADLLEDVLHDALPALPSPGRRALEVALLLDEADGPAPDVRAISGALLGVLRDVCAHTRVLVAVDDVQWMDEPSRTVLEFAIRRLRDEPVSLLVAQRGVGEEPPLGLGRALPLTSLQQLLLAPLSMGALHRLLEARLGTALSRPVLRRLYTTREGNPFYALEIGRALQRRGSALRPDEPLPIPSTLQQLLHERVAALPDRVRRMLELVATLYDRRIGSVGELARDEGLDGAVDEAITAGVLVEEGGRLAFTHPLLASVVYADMGPERRRAVHRLLAGRDDRNEASTVHLAIAASSSDPEVAVELDRSAARARARGAAASAARYAEVAAQLTPPADLEGSARRVITAADHYVVAGDPGRATELLGELVQRLPSGAVRADALSLLAWNAPGGDLAVGARLGEQALAEGAGEPRLEAITRLRLGAIEEIRGNVEISMTHRRLALNWRSGSKIRN